MADNRPATRDSFNPLYTGVIFMGGADAGPWEFNELQQILAYQLRLVCDRLFKQGVVGELTGSVDTEVTQGYVGNGQLVVSGGTFTGIETMQYKLKIVGSVPLPVGQAQFDFYTSGCDKSNGPITIEEFGVWYDLGNFGAKVKFMPNPLAPEALFVPGTTWYVNCHWDVSLPTVDPETNTITLPGAKVYLDGKVLDVTGTSLVIAPGEDKSIVYVEALWMTVTSDQDPDLLHPNTHMKMARRETIELSFRGSDTTGDDLPERCTRRVVRPAYEWDRTTNVVQRCVSHVLKLDLAQMDGVLPAEQVQKYALADELQGELALRDFEAHGSFIVEDKDLMSELVSSQNRLVYAVGTAKTHEANTGTDTLTSSGTYTGDEDQTYTVEATAAKTVHITSDGGDNNAGAGWTTTIEFGTPFALGTLGAFGSLADTDGDAVLRVGDRWTVPCTYPTMAIQTQKGVARPGGRRYEFADTEVKRVAIANSTANVQNEALPYTNGTQAYRLQKSAGTLGFPVKQISLIKAPCVAVVAMTRGSGTKLDELPEYGDPIQVLTVTKGTAAATVTGSGGTFLISGASGNEFIINASPWDGGNVVEQSIKFAPGQWTVEQIVEALNQCTGPAYLSGQANTNLYYKVTGGEIQVRCFGVSSSHKLKVGAGSANTALGMTPGVSDTAGTGTKYTQGAAADYTLNSNAIDWTPPGAEPNESDAYQVVYIYAKELSSGTSYRFGSSHAAGAKTWAVSAVRGGVESYPSAIASLTLLGGEVVVLSWPDIYVQAGGALVDYYHVYRAAGGGYAEMERIATVPAVGTGGTVTFIDTGYPEGLTGVAPDEDGASLMPPVTAAAWPMGTVNLNPPDPDNPIMAQEVDGNILTNRPLPGEQLSLDYDYYQPRYTLRCLDYEGNLVDIDGEPADDPQVPAPYSLSLMLASILCPANSGEATIRNYKHRRTTMAEIRSMAENIEELRYNVGLLDMSAQSQAGESTNPRGVYADVFRSIEQGDYARADFDAAVDPMRKCLMLPMDITTASLVVDTNNTTGSTEDSDFAALNLCSHKNTAMMRYSEVAEITQDLWTKETNVNPYAVSPPPERPDAWILLSPSRDYWVDVTTMRPEQFVQEYWQINIDTGETTQVWDTWAQEYQALTGKTPPSFEQVRTELKFLREESARFARQITVELYGMNFASDCDVELYIRGQRVAATALTGYIQGNTRAGVSTVRSNSFGQFRASFVIPSGLTTGAHVVKAVAYGTTEPHVGEKRNETTATFTSEGEVQVFQENQIHARYYVDPISQSFRFTSDAFITKMNIPMAAKDPNLVLTTMLRETDDQGYPTEVCDMVTVRKPSEVNVGTGSVNYYRPDDPVLTRSSAFKALTLMTESTQGYKAYVAKQQGDIMNAGAYHGKPLTWDSLPNAFFLDSSANLAWQEHHDTDLRFGVWRAKFTPGSAGRATIQFQPVTWSGHTMVGGFMLMAGQEVPTGTSAKWYVTYKMTGQDAYGDWIPVVPMKYVEFSGHTASAFVVKVVMESETERLSPVISKKTWSLVLMQRGHSDAEHVEGADTSTIEGNYFTDPLVPSDPEEITTVRTYLEEMNPAGTGFAAGGEVTGINPEPFDTTGGKVTLNIVVDGTTVDVTLTANAELGAQTAANDINARCTVKGVDDIASVVNGRVRLVSPTATASGYVEILSGLANAPLGFHLGKHIGHAAGSHDVTLSIDGGCTWMSPTTREAGAAQDIFTGALYTFTVGESEDGFAIPSVQVRIRQRSSKRYLTPLAQRCVMTLV